MAFRWWLFYTLHFAAILSKYNYICNYMMWANKYIRKTNYKAKNQNYQVHLSYDIFFVYFSSKFKNRIKWSIYVGTFGLNMPSVGCLVHRCTYANSDIYAVIAAAFLTTYATLNNAAPPPSPWDGKVQWPAIVLSNTSEN